MKMSWKFSGPAKLLFCLWLTTHTLLSPLNGHLLLSQMSPALREVTRQRLKQQRGDFLSKYRELSVDFGFAVTKETMTSRMFCYEVTNM